MLKSTCSHSNWAYYLCVIGLIIALKQFYSVANAAQLQWILYPLVLLLELFSELSFAATADFEWVDEVHRVSIVKSCAGINFMVISLMAYLWLWRHKPFATRLLLRALILAWSMSLCANTLRILLCIYTQEPLAVLLGITVLESHRFIGIVVYFLMLWALLSSFHWRNFRYTIASSTVIYLSITVFLPLLRAWVLGLQIPDILYITWVTGFPALMLILCFKEECDV